MNFSVSPCEKLQKQAVALLSGETSLLEKQWMDSHLRQCSGCRHSLNEMSEMLEVTRGQRFLPSPNVRDRVFSSLSERVERDAPLRSLHRQSQRSGRSVRLLAAVALTAGAASAVAALSIFLWTRPESLPKTSAISPETAADTAVLKTEGPVSFETKRVADRLFVGSPSKETAKYRVEKQDGQITITVDEGVLWFSFKPSSEAERLQVKGHGATVQVKGTILMVRVTAGRKMEVGVLSGKVTVIPENGPAEELAALEARTGDGLRVPLDQTNAEQGSRWSSGLIETAAIEKAEYEFGRENESASGKPREARSTSATDLFDEAEKQMSKGKYGEAARLLETLIARDGASERADTARLDLGRLYADKLHNPKRAVFHLNTYLNHRPNDASVPLLRKKICDLSSAEKLSIPGYCLID